MNSSSYKFSLIKTFPNALTNIILVPPLIGRCISEILAVSVTLGSTVISVAPFSLALTILLATIGCESAPLYPKMNNKSASSISGIELDIAPLPNE